MTRAFVLVCALLVFLTGCKSGKAPPVEDLDLTQTRNTLVGSSWCTQEGTFRYRQLMFQPDGTLIDAKYEKMSSDFKPSVLAKKESGRWSLEKSGLTLTIGTWKEKYSKIQFEDVAEGKDAKLYDSHGSIDVYYSCEPNKPQ